MQDGIVKPTAAQWARLKPENEMNYQMSNSNDRLLAALRLAATALANSAPTHQHYAEARELHANAQKEAIEVLAAADVTDASDRTAIPTYAQLLNAMQEIVKNDPFGQSSAGVIARTVLGKLA